MIIHKKNSPRVELMMEQFASSHPTKRGRHALIDVMYLVFGEWSVIGHSKRDASALMENASLNNQSSVA